MDTAHLIGAASFTPHSLQYPSAWVGHLPFAAWVIRDVAPGIFVELGVQSGNSYFSFCQSVLETGIATRCYAVDTWVGDAHSSEYGEDVFNYVDTYNRKHFTVFSILLRMTFDEALNGFADESIDLLHIDGLHTYEAVRHDFETWLPKLAPGALVLFHDTQVRDSGFGVWRFWQEMRERNPCTLEFVHSHGLGVLQLNNAPDDKKRNWLRLSTEDRQRFAEYFAALGERQLERYELKQQIAELNRVLADRDSQITALYQSTSWRMTRPFRFVGDWLKRKAVASKISAG